MSDPLSFASGNNTAFIEQMYNTYRQDPNQVDDSWKSFFAGYEFAQGDGASSAPSGVGLEHAKVEAFINAYRRLGHLSAHLNPLSEKPDMSPDMLPEAHGLGGVSATQVFEPSNFGSGPEAFSEILEKLQKTYCGSIGADFRDVNDISVITWLQNEMESCLNRPTLDVERKKRIHLKLAQAEGFERFLQARYLGQKRFSLEGLESLIPLLDIIIDESTEDGVEQVCLGMAHRGRLNVLANVMEKPYGKMLLEFEGSEFNPFDIDGDVKYHMGFGNEVVTPSGKSVCLFLCPNPSHLEAVNPVVCGLSRNLQQSIQSDKKVVPILLHGDASFIGQGIVHETLNLSDLQGYSCGGTIHVITNNQIGFTTNPQDARSCHYSSDIAKVVRAPVLHVNADDPEAVAWVATLASKYRQTFGRDVVIDLIGYRRHGHNETDEPGFTQPLMYKKIAQQPSSYKTYSDRLVQEGVYGQTDVDGVTATVKSELQQAYEAVKSGSYAYNWSPPNPLRKIFAYTKADRREIMMKVETGVREETLNQLVDSICTIPDGFEAHSKVRRILDTRKKLAQEKQSTDWALAELLAYASLAKSGHPVRLSGQDCKRGTFSHRHAVWFSNQTGESFEPLNALGGAPVSVLNSPLSEAGCLGFEFGYSVADPNALVLWEAQFGDFANGAQIIIDQFLLASEAKWQQTSGLVLLLPHGHEGMGPEHSSARPERFLQGCGNFNIQVANLTTPAQLFHVLRRQILRTFRKPLVIMSPKSLLRHPKVISNLSSLAEDAFQEIIDDSRVQPDKVQRLVMCTGKLFYDLDAIRDQRPGETDNTAIIRIEQLYPFAREQFSKIVARYPGVKEFIWAQEEPQNMGAWTYIEPRLRAQLPAGTDVRYIGRKHSGSTAEGSGKSHQLEQQRIVEETFNLVCAWEPKVAGS